MPQLTPQQAFDLARQHLEAGRLSEAEQICRRILLWEPAHAGSLHVRGIIASRLGRQDIAVRLIAEAIALNANNAEAYNDLGIARSRSGQVEEGLAAFRQAIALKRNYPEAYNNLGFTLSRIGQTDEAMAAYRQAIDLRPDYGEAISNLGLLLRDLGRFDEAADHFRRALTISPNPRFFLGLVSTGRKVTDTEELRRLGEAVERGGLSLDDRVDAGFALGKALDDAERFDDAFAHYAAANRLFKESRAAAGQRFDGEGLHLLVDRLINTYSGAFFADRPAGGDASELPVFIVGMPRSGTSLIEQIVASHPAVFGAGELNEIQRLATASFGGRGRSAVPGADPGPSPAWDSQAIAKAATAYLQHLRTLAPTAQRVTDKLPANVFYLGLIAVLFPGARVIFCRRDPRDTCLSCFFQCFNKLSDAFLYTYDLADCGRQHVETDRLTAHWLKTSPLRMLEVRYETLIADQEAQSRRLIEFLGLPWDPACLAFHRTERYVMTASTWQVRQPMYASSVGRWRHYERHLGPLLGALEGAT